MADSYNTSANQTKNKAYNYNPNQSPNLTLKGSVSEYNYTEIYDAAEPESNNGTNTKPARQSSNMGVWNINMGTAYNYTLYIKELNEADTSFNLPSRDGFFLPLKSLTFKPVKLDNLKINAGIFTDLPFFHRRSMGMLSCVMHDSDKSLIAQKLFHWWNSCVNTAGYVPYVADMLRDSEYTEYTHDGKVAVRYGFLVMPDGEISVDGIYDGDVGSLREYRFNLLIVSNIKVFNGSRGSRGEWVEADWGNGTGQRADYERRVHGTVFNYDNKGNNAYISDPAIADYVGRN